MVEKEDSNIIYPSSEQDLIEAFHQSPDIMWIDEKDDGAIVIHQMKDHNHNILSADLRWTKFKEDKPFYPILRFDNPLKSISMDIVFMKEGYLVNTHNLKSRRKTQQLVEDTMDTIQRGIEMIQIFRSIPMSKRKELGDQYFIKLHCQLESIKDPTLDCLSITSRAIDLAKRGKIKEIAKK